MSSLGHFLTQFRYQMSMYVYLFKENFTFSRFTLGSLKFSLMLLYEL
jgi:hypothetical protein